VYDEVRERNHTAGYVNGDVLAPRGGVSRLGEDSRQVLEELGYASADIDALIS
jgi:crotonobetainyl-CoA:carnitine CoA-transferase CaiB-like acyl-CoA transferase